MDIFDILKREEGFSSTPYVDTEGYVTIGFGTKLSTKNAPLEYFTLEVSENTAKTMCEEHLKGCEKYLSTKMLSYTNQARYIILQSMCYQLGEVGLEGFKKMWKAVEEGAWTRAAAEALDSRWSLQTPERALRHAEVLRTGKFEGVY